MENKSITDSIDLTNNPTLTIPIESTASLKLNQTDSLPATLAYLSRTYNDSIWKSTTMRDIQTIPEPKYMRANFKAVLFNTIELLFGYSVVDSTFSFKLDTCPHLLSKRLRDE